jgi:hypothetical protein
VKMDGTVVDYSGTYEEYLRSQAITGWGKHFLIL